MDQQRAIRIPVALVERHVRVAHDLLQVGSVCQREPAEVALGLARIVTAAMASDVDVRRAVFDQLVAVVPLAELCAHLDAGDLESVMVRYFPGGFAVA
jgi:hypothetical protein